MSTQTGQKPINISGEKVKLHRNNKGWTQEVLAKASGLSLRTVQRLEREGGGSGETLQALAAALEVEVGALFFEYPNPQGRWTKEKIMHAGVAIFVLFGAMGFLMILAGKAKMFWDVYSLLFALFFTYSATIVAFGVSGLFKSIKGLRYLFAEHIAPGRSVEQLVFIYKKQIQFCYAAGVIGVLVGCISIHGNFDLIESDEVFHKAYAVNILLFLYCAMINEAILRPLAAKLSFAK